MSETDAPPRREQILAAAGALFVAHGVRQVTTRQIAAAVGISQPSLYAFFPSRDAIAVAICCRAFGELRQRLDAASSGAAGAARFDRLARAYVRFGLDHPTAYRVAFMADLPDHSRAERGDVLAAGLDAYAVLHAAVAQTHGAAADIAAQSAWAALHGLVALLLARPDFPWAEREALIDHHVALTGRMLYG
ncbi:TetR/AcrR family transcriptional regulator [Sandarakinorhabdus rubra]|uniref:TetR/AcrR family transcriptional regulator n=1 Tax=Sandarakinorhabdus rubra TaxID=2672568 RepID=UPI001969F63C|nr:TetR/AcrR family transcriptional regulator [Sandarakinorhabdus rubra]